MPLWSHTLWTEDAGSDFELLRIPKTAIKQDFILICMIMALFNTYSQKSPNGKGPLYKATVDIPGDMTQVKSFSSDR